MVKLDNLYGILNICIFNEYLKKTFKCLEERDKTKLIMGPGNQHCTNYIINTKCICCMNT